MLIKTLLHRHNNTFHTISIASLFVTITIYSLIFEIRQYKNTLQDFKSQANSYHNTMENVIKYTFEYTNQLNTNIGRQIIGHEHDYEFIKNLLRKSTLSQKLSYSWTSFDWVDNQNLQRVNSQLGIRNPAPDMSTREYTALSPKHPWSLQFSKPVMGNPSEKFVIPVGTGITDVDGRYLGTVVVGFAVEDLINQMKQFVTNQNIGFMLKDKNGAQYLEYGNDIEYLSEGLVGEYPFILQVGFKRNVMQKEFLKKLYQDLIKIGFGMIFLGGLLYIVNRTLKKKDLLNEKQKISKASLLELSNTQLNSMKEQINKAIKRVNENMTKMENEDNLTDAEKQEMYSMLAVLYSIRDTLFSLTKPHLKSVNIDNIIQSVLKLKAVEILEANLQVNTEINMNEQIQLDEVKIIQLLSFVISYIIATGGRSLAIIVSKTNENMQISFVSPKIIDDKLIHHIQQDGINYADIRNIIYSHKAELDCKDGEIVLIIPNKN